MKWGTMTNLSLKFGTAIGLRKTVLCDKKSSKGEAYVMDNEGAQQKNYTKSETRVKEIPLSNPHKTTILFWKACLPMVASAHLRRERNTMENGS